MNPDEPLVSVLTPVHNGERYIAECIESILAQTYGNWEYIIVNNCSTDKSLEITESCAAREPRIRVHNNKDFVGVIENHNIAISLVAPQSKYVKVVSADDWLYTECISRLVAFAERNPTVGIVGSYSIMANGISSPGIPFDMSFFSGREICRRYLLGEVEVFGVPSAVLYRSSVIRARTPFFPTLRPSADMAACLLSLQTWDFGFVHQILSFQRVHSGAVSHRLRELGSFLVDKLDFLAEFGSVYLTEAEYRGREAQLLNMYYELLATGLINFRNREFWNFHKQRLAHLGKSLDSARLAWAVVKKLTSLLINPKLTVEKIARRLNRPRDSA